MLPHSKHWQAIFFWTLVVRHLARCFEKDPHLKLPPTPLDASMDIADYRRTALSSAQADQIREIFDLFDTDDTGSIDKREIQFALSALGFQGDAGKSKEELKALNSILDDGKVTLEEFSALMTGEIGGHSPYEEARSVFALLSRPDGDRRFDGLITLSKLEAVCMEYQVKQTYITFALPFICCYFISQHSLSFKNTCLFRYCYRLRTSR